MPNIETYTAKANAPRADSAGSEAFEMEGRHIEAAYAEAGSALGRGITQVGQAINEHNVLEDTTNVADVATQARIQGHKNLLNAQTNDDPQDPQGLQKFLDAQEPLNQKIREAAGDTQEGKQAADKAINANNAEFTDSYIGWQHTAAADQVINKQNNVVTSSANLAYTDPTSIPASLASVQAAAVGLPKNVASAHFNEASTKIYDSAMDGVAARVEKDPNRTPEQIDGQIGYLSDPKNGFVDNASPAQYASVMSRLNAAKQQSGNVANTIAAQNLNVELDQTRATGVVSPALQSIADNPKGSTPAERAEFQADARRQISEAVGAGQINNKIQGMTPDERADMSATINRRIADEQDPDTLATMTAIQKQFVASNAALDRDRKADPAGSAMGFASDGTQLRAGTNGDGVPLRGSPTIFNAYQTMLQDPSPKNVQTYITLQTAYQQHVSPDQPVNLVPKQYADQLGAQIGRVKNGPQGPDAAAKYESIIGPEAKKWGAAWPSIAIQLRQDKVISGSVGVGAELYGSVNTQALGETVLQASALSPEDLKNKFGISSEKAMAPVNRALKPLIATMANLPNSDRLIADYRDAAVQAVQYTGDVNSAAATVQKMLTNRYDIADTTLRIPKSLGIDSSRVSDGVKAVRSDIGSRQLVLPPGFAAMHVTPDRYASQIKSSGKWFTNENNTGALLYDVDGHNVQELKNGKPTDVELSWEELGKVADKQPLRSIDRSLAGFIGGQ